MFRFTNLIVWRFTRDCNLDCKYCFMKEKNLYKGEIIDFELFKKIVQRIIKQRLENNLQDQRLSISLHGGEFLLVGKERLYKMLEYMKTEFHKNNINHDLGCQTNATLIDDEFAKIFQKFDVRIGMSFDGIHDSNKNRTDIKQEVFENKFDVLKNNKVPFSFIVVAGQNNIDKIEETKEYLDNVLDVPEYKINYAEDMDSTGFGSSEIEVSGKELFEKVWKPDLERILKGEKVREWRIRNIVNDTLIDILTYHEDNRASGCLGKYCGAGITMIAIEPDGNMDYCDRYSKSFPEAHIQHALDYDFLGLHQIRKVLELNKKKIDIFKEIGCDTCYANYICEYGCMAFHYSKFGEYGIEKDLVCDQFKMIYDYVLKNLDEFINIFLNKKILGRDKIYKPKTLMVEYLNKKNLDLCIDDFSIEIRER